MIETKKIWMDGNLVDWKDAKVHFLTHALHYGSAVFEGIRCYKTDKGTAIFRLDDHVKRLLDSAKIFGIKVSYSKEELKTAIKKTVKINDLDSCYIRPLIFVGYGQMGMSIKGTQTSIGIACFPMDPVLGDTSSEGIRAKISSFRRLPANAMLTKAKASGNYINSIYAKNECLNAGYDEAILLDENGFISECSGENIFIVRNKTLISPPKATILEGITRDSIIDIADNLNIPFKEENITRDQLYVADEIFFCGTAAEIVPVKEIDDRLIGKPGPITKKIISEFKKITDGKTKIKDWLDYI